MTTAYDQETFWLETGKNRQLNPSNLYARHKLLLVNAVVPSERMPALFNPEQLPLSIGVTAGRLHPIGWSHPVKQYAYTGEVSFPLRLAFTHLAMQYGGPPISRKTGSAIPQQTDTGDVRDPVNWISSFCYADDPGYAPPPLLIIWPQTLTMLVTVDNLKVTYTKWASRGKPTVAVIDLRVSELRKGFRFRGSLLNNGWAKSDEGHSLNGPGRGFFGGGLKMGGSGGR